jgi:hypothetical protein
MARVTRDLFVGQLREFGGEFFENGWHEFLLEGTPPPSLFAQNLQKIEVRVGTSVEYNLQNLQNKGHRATSVANTKARRLAWAASGYTLIVAVRSSDAPFLSMEMQLAGATIRRGLAPTHEHAKRTGRRVFLFLSFELGMELGAPGCSRF